jgi:hypothetical protein
MILKTNKETCYFYCDDVKSDKFIESPNLKLFYNGEIIDVNLDTRTNVIVGRNNNGTTYVIDDGYRNMLIRAGYIVYKNYDEVQTDKNDGAKIQDELIYVLYEAINKSYPEAINNINDLFNGYELEKEGYKFSAYLYHNIDIVKKNQERKINGLQFYPFDKRMDNYGTLYIMVYGQRISDQEPQVKSNILVDNILSNIITNSDDLKFVVMDINNPLYYTRGK